jgi:O-methyltransferase
VYNSIPGATIALPDQNQEIDLRQRIRSLLNSSLSPIGVEVMSRKTAARLRQSTSSSLPLLRLLRELEGAFRTGIVPHLPECPDRVELLSALLGTSPSEALYLLGNMHRCFGLPGDVCEFGVAQGCTSALLGNEIKQFTDKHLWLFDSFQGLPRPGTEDILIDDIFGLGSIERYEGTMACPDEMVRRRLADISFPPTRLHIVKGFIEDSIRHTEVPGQVAFAYVDFDFYSPIRIALEYLDSVMPVGGIIIVDDYGFFSAGAQQAVDEFIRDRPAQWHCDLPPDFAGRFAILRRTS